MVLKVLAIGVGETCVGLCIGRVELDRALEGRNRSLKDVAILSRSKRKLAPAISPAIFERSVMMSSVMPSEKYSCSGSRLMFVKGRTAIEGFSGRFVGAAGLAAAGWTSVA